MEMYDRYPLNWHWEASESFLRAVNQKILRRALVSLNISDFNLTIKFDELEYFLVLYSVGVCQNFLSFTP